MSLSSNQMMGLLAVAGGGAYLLTRDDDEAADALPPAVQSQPLRKATLQWHLLATLKPMHADPAEKAGNGGSLSGLPKPIEDQIKADLKKSWESASKEAKIAVCQRMKAQFPNDAGIQSMNCMNAPNMAFQAILGAAGAAAGNYVCGPPCSVVGILVAAWAGPTLEEWGEAAWSKIKGGASDVWEWLF